MLASRRLIEETQMSLPTDPATRTHRRRCGARAPRRGRPHRDPPLRGPRAGGGTRRPAPPSRSDALADPGAGPGPLAGRAAGDHGGAHPVLGDRVRLAPLRGEAERAAAVRHGDRRRGHPLHPRAVAARGRAAVDHDARLARLRRRAARHHRPADGPHRPRRTGRGRLRPRAALAAGLRLLRRTDGARLGLGPRGARLGGADEPARLRPLRRPGWGRGCPRHGPRWAARRSRA